MIRKLFDSKLGNGYLAAFVAIALVILGIVALVTTLVLWSIASAGAQMPRIYASPPQYASFIVAHVGWDDVTLIVPSTTSAEDDMIVINDLVDVARENRRSLLLRICTDSETNEWKSCPTLFFVMGSPSP